VGGRAREKRGPRAVRRTATGRRFERRRLRPRPTGRDPGFTRRDSNPGHFGQTALRRSIVGGIAGTIHCRVEWSFWYMNHRTAAEVLGVSPTLAGQWLRMLVADGVLTLETTGRLNGPVWGWGYRYRRPGRAPK